jgi:hypothetical protein
VLQATANRIIDQEAAGGLGSLPGEEQVFFLVWIADGEVGNGGMHAVCYNSTGNYLSRLPEAFRTIGAPRKAEAFERLIKAFGPGGPSPEHATRLEQHGALSDNVAAEIDRLDQLYFESKPKDVTAHLFNWCAPWAAARLGA